MTTFAEQLKTLTTPELEKLEKILLFLARNDNRDFEELLAQIGATESALSKTDADLIGSRTYELEIYNHLDAASARKQAMQEFEAGKLHKPEKPIPRYRPREETNPAGPTALAGNSGPRRADRRASDACNRSTTTLDRNVTGQRCAAPPLLQILSQQRAIECTRTYLKIV